MSGSNGFATQTVEPSAQLLAQLNDPKTAEALSYVLKHADTLAFLLGGVDGFIQRGETITDNVSETLRELRPALSGHEGAIEKAMEVLPKVSPHLPELIDSLPLLVEVGLRLKAASQTKEFQALMKPGAIEQSVQLLAQMNQPKTVNALSTLLNHSELLAFMVESLDGFIKRGETITDNIGDSLREINGVTGTNALDDLKETAGVIMKALPHVKESLPQFVDSLPQLIAAGLKVKDVVDSPEFNAFLNSGMLAPRTVEFLGQVGDAMAETSESIKNNPQRVGLLGLLSAMRDPDVQLGLGFVAEFGKKIGQKLNANKALTKRD